jgi:L-asparaginase II
MVRLKLRSQVGLQATVVNSDGTVLATGGFPVFGVGLRAGISPLHAVPLVASGAADALALSTEELAVACRVRNASGPLHRAIISSMLGKAGVPIAETPRETQGALASMLATCHYLGWDCSTCMASHHPLQRWIGTIVSASYGLPTAGVEPAYPVGPPLTVPASTDQGPLAAAMLADPGGAIWEGLASAGPAVARLRDAILSRPELVTGDNSIETIIICATDGAVLADLAAPNLLCLAVPHAHVGIAVGGTTASPQQVTADAISVLAQLELVDGRTMDRLRRRLPRTAAGRTPKRRGGQAGTDCWAAAARCDRSVGL